MTEIDPQDDMYQVKEDTPINKATLLELSLEDQRKYIATLQARRIRVKEHVTKARVAKEKCTEDKKLSQAINFEKLEEKLDKLHTKIEADLTKAEKIVNEIIAHRMAIGEYD